MIGDFLLTELMHEVLKNADYTEVKYVHFFIYYGSFISKCYYGKVIYQDNDHNNDFTSLGEMRQQYINMLLLNITKLRNSTQLKLKS